MAIDRYGFRSGTRTLVKLPVDSGGTVPIEVGDLVTLGSAGYVQQAAAGDIPYGVAVSRVETDGSADGDRTILVDISPDTVYEYPPDTGSVDATKLFKTCDVGGARSIDHDATVDDVILIIGTNADLTAYYVQIRPTFAGV